MVDPKSYGLHCKAPAMPPKKIHTDQPPLIEAVQSNNLSTLWELKERYRAALARIERWHGEFPVTGQSWPSGNPVSYGAAFGSNGERDYMRDIAREALSPPALIADVPPSHEDHDGYALRLAIEHRVSIKQQYGRVTAKGRFSATVSFRNCGGDPCAATRLAIARAAGLTIQMRETSA